MPSSSPLPAPATTLIPLSFNQEFLCTFDRGNVEGAFGLKHTLSAGWRVRGQFHVNALWAALGDVVHRHEALRSTIVRGANHHQVIHPPRTPDLRIRDLSDVDRALWSSRAEELLDEIDAEDFPVTGIPHLRATLGYFNADESVLVLSTHHVATDSWSMALIFRDLMSFYHARRGLPVANLPRVHQYREFCLEQQAEQDDARLDPARSYWREALQGARIVPIASDHDRQPDAPARYAVQRFLVDATTTSAVLRLGATVRSSPFMVLMAAYHLYLRSITGAVDIVVPTFTSGRYADRYFDTVGPFFNFLPLRLDQTGCVSFRDVLLRTRTACLQAYANDIPFHHIVAEAPQLPEAFAADDAVVAAFEILQTPATTYAELAGELTTTEIRRRLLSQTRCSDIPDGVLWAIDVLPSGELAGSLKYDNARFEHATMAAAISAYTTLLRELVATPDAPLVSML